MEMHRVGSAEQGGGRGLPHENGQEGLSEQVTGQRLLEGQSLVTLSTTGPEFQNRTCKARDPLLRSGLQVAPIAQGPTEPQDVPFLCPQHPHLHLPHYCPPPSPTPPLRFFIYI